MKNKQKKEWPCQKCGDCCSIIPISNIILNKYRSRFQREVTEEYATDDRHKTIITSDGRCVFSQPNGLCAIYDERPEICRAFGNYTGPYNSCLECHRVSRSGRIRNAEEVKRALKRLQKEENDVSDPDLQNVVLGVNIAPHRIEE